MTARISNAIIGRAVGVAAALAVFLVAHTSSAGLIQIEVEGNDCVGVFSGLSGSGFNYCSVLPNDADEELSPIIVKFGTDDDGNITGVEVDDMGHQAINALYPSVTGDEWSFTGGGEDGTFQYNPGEGDPAVRYWAAKAGSAFNLHFYVDGNPDACSANPLGIDCLSLATVIPTGVDIPWHTGNGNNLSHLSFYDTEGPIITETVEPATLSFLGLGLLALSRVRQRRRKS